MGSRLSPSAWCRATGSAPEGSNVCTLTIIIIWLDLYSSLYLKLTIDDSYTECHFLLSLLGCKKNCTVCTATCANSQPCYHEKTRMKKKASSCCIIRTPTPLPTTTLSLYPSQCLHQQNSDTTTTNNNSEFLSVTVSASSELRHHHQQQL